MSVAPPLYVNPPSGEPSQWNHPPQPSQSQSPLQGQVLPYGTQPQPAYPIPQSNGYASLPPQQINHPQSPSAQPPPYPQPQPPYSQPYPQQPVYTQQPPYPQQPPFPQQPYPQPQQPMMPMPTPMPTPGQPQPFFVQPQVAPLPLMTQPMIITQTLTPPPIFTPPFNPADPSIADIKFHDEGLMDNVRIYRVPPEAQKQQIHNFVLAHTETPTMEIYVEGYRWVEQVHRDANGNTRTERRRHVDWHLTFNPSIWIAGPGSVVGLEEAVSRFADSKKTLKSLELKKHVNWDRDGFSHLARNLAISKGYRHHVDVTYRYTNKSEKVLLEGANNVNDTLNSTCCKVLCCVTCLCICWTPIKSCMTDKFFVRNEFAMAISPQDYLSTVSSTFPTYANGFNGACSIQ